MYPLHHVSTQEENAQLIFLGGDACIGEEFALSSEPEKPPKKKRKINTEPEQAPNQTPLPFTGAKVLDVR